MRDLKERFKKFFRALLPKSTAEWLDTFVAILGIAMIFVSVYFDSDQEHNTQKKLLSVVGDLGIGIFPTGIIGLLLERMQNREKGRQIQRIRAAILKSLNVSIHSYFNTICNSAISRCPGLKGRSLNEILQKVQEEQLLIDQNPKEKEALKHFLSKIKITFETPDPTYIIADIFSPSEEGYFLLLIEKGEALLSEFDQGRIEHSHRSGFIGYLKTSCEEIPEWNRFMNMVSDGNNISIPSNTTL